MRPSRDELRTAIVGCPVSIWGLVAAGGMTPDGLADAILAAWPDPEPMDGDQAADYAAELAAELGRVIEFIRDDLAGDAALSGRLHQSPSCWCGQDHDAVEAAQLSGAHLAGECWCRQTHTVPGARSLNRRHP